MSQKTEDYVIALCTTIGGGLATSLAAVLAGQSKLCDLSTKQGFGYLFVLYVVCGLILLFGRSMATNWVVTSKRASVLATGSQTCTNNGGKSILLSSAKSFFQKEVIVPLFILLLASAGMAVFAYQSAKVETKKEKEMSIVFQWIAWVASILLFWFLMKKSNGNSKITVFLAIAVALVSLGLCYGSFRAIYQKNKYNDGEGASSADPCKAKLCQEGQNLQGAVILLATLLFVVYALWGYVSGKGSSDCKKAVSPNAKLVKTASLWLGMFIMPVIVYWVITQKKGPVDK